MVWREGTLLPELRIGPITTEMLVRWAAVSGDYNPIHYDYEFARKQGLPSVVMHGPYTLALLCRLLHGVLGSTGLIRMIKVRYAGLVLPGDELVLRGSVGATQASSDRLIAKILLKAENQKGMTAAEGVAEVEVRQRDDVQAESS